MTRINFSDDLRCLYQTEATAIQIVFDICLLKAFLCQKQHASSISFGSGSIHGQKQVKFCIQARLEYLVKKSRRTLIG